MNISEIESLLAKVDASSIRQFELDGGDFHLVLNKNETAVLTPPTDSSESSETVSPSETTTQTIKPQAVVASGTAVKSPLVGIVYLAPTPDAPVYKQVGDHVSLGETICIIEAMKMMNEVQAPCDGTVTSVTVENGSMVEFDQLMMTIEPTKKEAK